MTTQKTMSGWKRIAAAGALALSLVPNFSMAADKDDKGASAGTAAPAKAGGEEEAPKLELVSNTSSILDDYLNANWGLRLREEYTGDEQVNSDIFKTTTEISASNGFLFRDYHYTGRTSGDDKLNYEAFGLNIPINLKDVLSNNLSLFGTQGDRRGQGLQNDLEIILDKAKNRSLFLTFNAEEAEIDGKNPTRVGLGADLKLGNWLVGAAVDRVRTGAGKTDYFLAKTIWDASKTDQFGAASRRAQAEDNSTNSVLGYWGHTGEKAKVGTRTAAEVSWNNKTGARTIYVDSIVCENPTFGPGRNGSFDWLVGRRRGDMFGTSVTESALDPERCPLQYRTRKGLFLETQGSLTQFEGDSSGYFRVDLGDKFAPTKSFSIGPEVFAKRVFAEGKDNCDFGGAGVLAEYTPGNGKYGTFTLEVSGCKPIGSGNHDDRMSAYGSLQYSVGFDKIAGWFGGGKKADRR